MPTLGALRRPVRPSKPRPDLQQPAPLAAPSPCILLLFFVGALLEFYLGYMRAFAAPPPLSKQLPPVLEPLPVPIALPLPPPPLPRPQRFDAAAYLQHLTGPASDPRWGLRQVSGSSDPAFDPWPGAQRGGPWREFSRSQLLACLVARGGVGFIGDSVMRLTVNALLEQLLGPGVDRVDDAAPHAQQRYDRDFGGEAAAAAGVASSGNGSAPSARVAFRFVTNLAPQAGSAAADMLLGERMAGQAAAAPAGASGSPAPPRLPPVRALVVASGFWDLNPGQGGGDDRRALSTYATRLARFLVGLKATLAAAAQGAAAVAAGQGGAPPAATRLLWRSITPIAYERAPEDRRDFLSLGRTMAANAVARGVIEGAWNQHSSGAGAGGGGGGGEQQQQQQQQLLPRFTWVDSALLFSGEADRISLDGYHPSNTVLSQLVWALFSELCPVFEMGEAGVLEALAEEAVPE